MKRSEMWRVIISIVVVGTGLYTSRVFAQGSLVPSNGPTATMKTLDQVEPRIPISVAGYSINEPGSYYLTTNIYFTGFIGIGVNTNNVTLDLNGFSIDGSKAAAGSGLYIKSGVERVTVKNGLIVNCFASGIFATGSRRCTYTNLRLIGNGRGNPVYRALNGGSFTRVEGCYINDNLAIGLAVNTDSIILDSEITGNIGKGIYLIGGNNIIRDNVVRGNGDNYDISSGNNVNILLCEVPETLDWPCSVKFVGTLTCSATNVDGIAVNANNVTIDMDGHTLIGPGDDSMNGISQGTDYYNLRVCNGMVINWNGYMYSGINAVGENSDVENIKASTNYYGITAGDGSKISKCTVYMNHLFGLDSGFGSTVLDSVFYKNSIGIYARNGVVISRCAVYRNDSGIVLSGGVFYGRCSKISDCAIYDNNSVGITSSGGPMGGGIGHNISNCSVNRNGSHGISVVGCSLIYGCTVSENDGCGICAGYSSTVSDCIVVENHGDGIQVSTKSLVKGNNCSWNGVGDDDGAGIFVTGSGNKIDSNVVTGSDRGIDVGTNGNMIVCNSVSGNSINWSVAAGNACLVVQAVNSGAINGNTGGISPGSTDPNANYTY